jgi:endoglucanase
MRSFHFCGISISMGPMKRTLLDQILSQPTSPFREGHVISLLTGVLEAGNVPHFQDPAGNLIVGVANQKEYRSLLQQKTDEPLRIFIAHMDHPGFHGESWTQKKASSEGTLQVKWHGGSPTADLEGAKVWVADRTGWQTTGTFTRAVLHESGRMIVSGEVRFEAGTFAEIQKRFPKGTELFGGFGFRAPVWQEGDLLYTKAADDLVGCFAIVSTALDLFENKKGNSKTQSKSKNTSFLGLLTRAEEVGFIGAIAHLNLGWIKKSRRTLMAVSLETSRTLPGAEFGKGPVVRLGDRYTVFDPGKLRVFTELAEKVLPGKHQRRIMDGGSCEATAATVFGIPAIGISVPLGNYHNQCFEGGPDSRAALGPAPEFVHLDDVQGLLELCKGILLPKQSWNRPWDKRQQDFRKSLKNYRALLKSEP